MTEIPGRNITESGRVYLIGHADLTGPVKIGFTTEARLPRRLTELRTRAPGASGSVIMPAGISRDCLALLVAAPGRAAVERHVKRQWLERRVAGEWFDLGPDPIETFRTAVALAEADSSTWPKATTKRRRITHTTERRMAVNCGNHYWI